MKITDLEATPLDHPNCRASASCPLCGYRKDAGIVVCWACYRKHALRNGGSRSINNRLDSFERAMAATGSK